MFMTLKFSESPGPLPMSTTDTPAARSSAAFSWRVPRASKLLGILLMAPTITDTLAADFEGL